MTRVVLSLGANLGNRQQALRDAVAALGPEKVSDVYETPPWGDPDQPTYYNVTMTAHDDTADVDEWLARCQACEKAAGRVRDPNRRYGPRVLDVDMIAAYDKTGEPILRDTAALTLPHPRAHLRAFVLAPWHAIEPDASLPGHGPIRDLLAEPTVAADARELHSLGGLGS